MIMINHPNG
ncbi:hypothetical protein F383_38562 [Gossypium arboreum]|uniref:Uncharacterized protein n=1 Tax=Gossypium arboreum TaxID=29729 RepID=A0A0B0NQZ8_GOSAR|nr:hypothetical protein F383_38562 [Gossypium arboreum]